MLEQWEKDDEMLVSTVAADHVYRCLIENNCVTVTGNPGVGKTYTVRHVALRMRQEGYTVVPTSIPEDIRNFTKPGSKTLFVIDDICGNYTLNQTYLDKWKLVYHNVKQQLQNNYCKIIATCRLQVFKDEKFKKELAVFSSCECNLNSKELSLTSDEKSSLSQKYFKGHACDIKGLLDKYDFFPLLCNLYQRNKSVDLDQFVSNPFQFYTEELDHLPLQGEGGKYKYCALALCVVFNNNLNEKYLTCKVDREVLDIIEDTLTECELNRGTPPKCLQKALQTLEGTLVVNDNGHYRIIHDKLFDFMAYYFGNKIIEILIDHADDEFIIERFIWRKSDDMEDIDFTINIPDDYVDCYIDRTIKDWEQGKVLSVFNNRNMKTAAFTSKLLDHLNQHEQSYQHKLANMTDKVSHYSALLLSCFVGDVSIVKWMLDHNVDVNQCNTEGISLLYKACQKGFVEIVRELVQHGSDINKCRQNGWSPLQTACYNGHINVVRELLKNASVMIDLCENEGCSPLYSACEKGFVEIVRELVQHGSDINKCQQDGWSPLQTACYNGHIDVVRELLKNDSVMIDLCDNEGFTPLHIAYHKGFVEIVRVLVRVSFFRVSSFELPFSSFELQFSSFELPFSSFELPFSSFELPFSSFELPFSSFELQFPSFELPFSSFELPFSSFELQFPSFELPFSSFELPFSSFELPFSSFELPFSSFELQFPSFELPFSSFELPFSSFELQFPSFELPFSSFELPFSSFELPFSSFELQFSSFELPFSSFELQFSSFELPFSSFELPFSSFELPFSSFELSKFPDNQDFQGILHQ